MKAGTIALAIIALILSSGCVQQTAGKETIKIGAILPLTGETMIWGENIRSGIDLAVEEINREGIGGRQLEIIYEDSQCNPAKAASSIQRLVSVDKVQVVIGEACSSATLAAAPIAESGRVVLISPYAAADKISEAGDFIFRNYPKNSQLADGAVELLKKTNSESIAVLFVNNDFGIGLKDNIVKQLPDKIALTEGHDQKATDFRTTLTKIKEQNIGTVFLATYYTDGALILKQAKELNMDCSFFGPDVFDDPKVIEIAGNAANGIIFVTVKNGAGSTFAEFRAKYKNKYNKEPPYLADFGYDTANIIAAAMKQGNLEGKQIRDFLYNLKDYPGASNTITFDNNGDLENPALTIKTIKNGEFVLYEGGSE